MLLVQLGDAVGAADGDCPGPGGQFGDSEATAVVGVYRRANVIAGRGDVDVARGERLARAVAHFAGDHAFRRQLQREFLLPAAPAEALPPMAGGLRQYRRPAESKGREVRPAVGIRSAADHVLPTGVVIAPGEVLI